MFSIEAIKLTYFILITISFYINPKSLIFLNIYKQVNKMMRGINIHTTQLMEKTNERYSIRKYKVFNKTKQKIIKNLIQNIQIYQKNIKFN